MYSAPRVTDFGRIELHTYQLPGSSSEVEELPTATGGGGGAGVGLIGLLGGAVVLAGRGGNDQAVVASNDEEEKSVPQK